jgi:general stress protein YciG
MNTTKNFDPIVWRAECNVLANEAGKSCSQSHTLYVSNFSNAIEARLEAFTTEDKEKAIEIARKFDYATPQEIEVDAQWNSENGFCSHGIELGCCPAGCGSGPDD